MYEETQPAARTRASNGRGVVLRSYVHVYEAKQTVIYHQAPLSVYVYEGEEQYENGKFTPRPSSHNKANTFPHSQ
jgi:hypothetical protein